MPKVETSDYKGYYISHALRSKDNESWFEIFGWVASEHGIVAVSYDFYKSNKTAAIQLTFVSGGISHSRLISGKRYKERGLITLARRYAKEVATSA